MTMAVQQLTQTIYADDFQNKVYSFPVDSVLHTETEPGRLVISASEGYLLSTPLADQPERELSLPYQQQADGSWAAHSVITLLGSERELTDGLVRIQNAVDETTILTIQAESAALARAQAPLLTVSESLLTFPSTSPGTPKFAVLTIAQQHANELITISSDAPDYFQLASDKYPNYTHTLTLQPMPMGTYVHVRYLANKSGRHDGHLTIQSTYDEKAVTLQGRSASLLPVVRSVRPAYTTPERVDSSGLIKKAAIVLGAVFVLGLAWLGYTYRMSLSPPESTTAPAGQSVGPMSVAPSTVKPTTEAADKPSILTRTETSRSANRRPVQSSSVTGMDEQSDPSSTEPTLVAEPTAQKISPQRVVQNSNGSTESTRKPAEEVTTKQPNGRAKPTRAEESELEKELNQLPPN